MRKIINSIVCLAFAFMMINPGLVFGADLPVFSPDGLPPGVSYNYNGNELTITGGNVDAILKFTEYCIGHGYTVRYDWGSPLANVFNRVVGTAPSEIFGNLIANCKVWIINPNGIVFGQNSQVDVAGLVASTLNISNQDLMNGNYLFYGNGLAAVINNGTINVQEGGSVALLGAHVENNGVITAKLGTVALAAGEAITLNVDAKGQIAVAIDEALTKQITDINGNPVDDAVLNKGTIVADGGMVILSAKVADGIFKHAVNNEGVIEAQSLANRNGSVYLLAEGENALVSNSGTIDVSAKESGVDAGFVELSAPKLDFTSGKIDTSSVSGKSGSLLLDPWDFVIGPLEALWLENFTNGNVTISADNDIFLRIIDDNLDLHNYGLGEYFRLLAGHDIDLGDNTITTNGANIELYADYNRNNHGQIKWNLPELLELFNGWNGGLHSNGGDIILSGADVDLRYDFGCLFGGEHIASIDAGSGTVYFSPSTQKQVSWTRGWQCHDMDFVLSAQGLEAIKAGKIVIGTTDEGCGAFGGDIRADGYLDLSGGDCDTLHLFSKGNIYGNNSDPFDVKVSNLQMIADDNIGSSANRLNTRVDNLWAYALDGSIFLNELDGINLNEVHAYGSTVDILTAGLTNIFDVLASGTGAADPAVVNIANSGGDTNIYGVVQAIGNAGADALINVSTVGNLFLRSGSAVSSSSLLGSVANNLGAGLNLESVASVVSAVSQAADATNNFSSGGDLVLKDGTNVYTQTENGLASNSVVSMGGDVHIINSSAVGAYSVGAAASNLLGAAHNLELANNSSVVTYSTVGDVVNSLSAVGGNLSVKDGSSVAATTNDGSATNVFSCGYDMEVINSSSASAFSTNGVAMNVLSATDDLGITNNSSITSSSTNNVALNVASGRDILVSNASSVNANGDNGATNSLSAGNDLTLLNSSAINAFCHSGSAMNVLGAALGSIWLDNNSSVYASDSRGDASNTLSAGDGIDITDSSSVTASATYGQATNELTAANDINLGNTSGIAAYGTAGASNTLVATTGDISSSLSSIVASSDHDANNYFSAGNDILFDNFSNIYADGNTAAGNALEADHDINVVNGSYVSSYSEDGPAVNFFEAGNDINVDAASGVYSHTLNDLALAVLFAQGAIAANNVSAYSQNDLAAVALLALGNIDADNITTFGGLASGILLGSLHGDINTGYLYADDAGLGSAIALLAGDGNIELGDLYADLVVAAAFGLDGFGAIYDNGDVNATYAALIAKNDIGTSLKPVNTNVDYLTAYSFDTGDIWINEFNDIQLGFDIPDTDLTNLFGTGFDLQAFAAAVLGMPLPAVLTDVPVQTNNGNVVVTAGGDINAFNVVAGGDGVATGNAYLNAVGSIRPVGSGTQVTSAGDTWLLCGGVIGYPLGAPLNVNVGGDLYIGPQGMEGLAVGSAFPWIGLYGIGGWLSGSVSGSYHFIPGMRTYYTPVAFDPAYIFMNGAEIWPLIPWPFGGANPFAGDNWLKNYYIRPDGTWVKNYQFSVMDQATAESPVAFYHPLTELKNELDLYLSEDAYAFVDNAIELSAADGLRGYLGVPKPAEPSEPSDNKDKQDKKKGKS